MVSNSTVNIIYDITKECRAAGFDMGDHDTIKSTIRSFIRHGNWPSIFTAHVGRVDKIHIDEQPGATVSVKVLKFRSGKLKVLVIYKFKRRSTCTQPIK